MKNQLCLALLVATAGSVSVCAQTCKPCMPNANQKNTPAAQSSDDKCECEGESTDDEEETVQPSEQAAE